MKDFLNNIYNLEADENATKNGLIKTLKENLKLIEEMRLRLHDLSKAASRETALLQLITMVSKQLDHAESLEDVRFWNELMIKQVIEIEDD